MLSRHNITVRVMTKISVCCHAVLLGYILIGCFAWHNVHIHASLVNTRLLLLLVVLHVSPGLNIGGAPAAASTHCLPCVFTMTNYSQLKRAGDSWYSPPFYTSPQGYKFYLTVYANGSGGAAGKYVSVFVDIMKGEYDDRLNWPFQGAITFQLVNQREDSDHIAWTADYSGWAGCGARVFTEERANRRLGKPKFISHLEIEEVSLRRMYLHNDCLTWKLMYMQLH